MEKAERNLVEPVQNINMNQTRARFSKGMEFLLKKSEVLFIQKGLLIFIIGFLLGRAFILSQLTPFSLPFFAAVLMLKKQHAPIALIGVVSGAITISFGHTAHSFLLSLAFLLFFKITKQGKRNPYRSLPLAIFTFTLIGKITAAFINNGFISLYDIMMGSVEGCLAFILTLIFLQSIPLLAVKKRKQALKTEEIVCLIILLASVMTGTIGWTLYGVSIEHVMSRYLVLIFAFVAGATVGSTVGVVTGLIFSLANISSFFHMSLLAFSGLLGGLLKEGKKPGVAIGLFISTLLIGMYGQGEGTLVKSLYESFAAIVLFFLTPKVLTSRIAKYIPGTTEYAHEQQLYMRKVRDVTAKRVNQFSAVFEALSHSFQQNEIGDEEDENKELDYFLSNVTEKTCQTCFKKDYCWAKNFNTTYDGMSKIMQDLENNDGQLSQKVKRDWSKHCTRSNQVIEAIRHELSFYQANQKLKRQVKESRKLVANQLQGVSEVMGNFAREIQRERENHEAQEEQILDALQSFGLDVSQVEIFSLTQGNVDIEMTVPSNYANGECEKLIAPLLSDICGENIVVQQKEQLFLGGDIHVIFRSSKRFTVSVGVAHAAKDGGLVSGDSYSTIELGMGKYAIAISDGMGNGERAHHESNETLQLLRKILLSGIEEKVAIKSVNSILSLRTTDEIFSTLDLAIIDLQDASSRFLKIGSTPSFIKRGNQVKKIQASNLPIGIIQEFEVDVVSEQLKAGDLLVMMSDGVFEGPRHVENYELWMKRKLKELQTDEPQEIADLIMEEVIRSGTGEIKDDMTIIVAKLQHNTPKWAAIPLNITKRKAL
ncbi:stage II sporulation protein E [Bacillus oleivorans]|uniref:Stage II sporulation protein E n=1 Tax=Bacillus oleivorans TaxID=1448271 RepID=A0A285D7B3_9BACI|nr:stage II sporulation protein E [Bacillus oleivorans]SNX75692.1 stage II sporulation protein E [Bacillus oleivorans]